MARGGLEATGPPAAIRRQDRRLEVRLVMFSKMLASRSVEQMIPYARERRLDGYDLAVRPDHPVNPENAPTELPRAVAVLGEAGLAVPMITAPTSLTDPGDPMARPLLGAMRDAGIGLVKIGYYKLDAAGAGYLERVSQVRESLARWEELGREYGVKICCHTHSDRNMGLNAGALMHLLEGRDPDHIGAFLDTMHLRFEGEAFPTAVTMAGKYLSIVALKDVLLRRVQVNGHGGVERSMPEAGGGMVDFTEVFETLGRVGFDGPVSMHCEFHVEPGDFDAASAREAAFFRNFV